MLANLVHPSLCIWPCTFLNFDTKHGRVRVCCVGLFFFWRCGCIKNVVGRVPQQRRACSSSMELSTYLPLAIIQFSCVAAHCLVRQCLSSCPRPETQASFAAPIGSCLLLFPALSSSWLDLLVSEKYHQPTWTPSTSGCFAGRRRGQATAQHQACVPSPAVFHSKKKKKVTKRFTTFRKKKKAVTASFTCPLFVLCML